MRLVNRALGEFMEGSNQEWAEVIRELHARLRTLAGFGIQQVRAAVTSQEQVSAEAPGSVPQPRAVGEYRFGDGRQARWAQAAMVHEPKADGREAEEPRSKQQAHLFGAAPAEHQVQEQAGWMPNPLDPGQAQAKMDELRNEIGDCKRCRLAKTRNHIVFGEGLPTARLVFAGEGPGRDEDASGRPFVGRAGQLLDRIIKAMGFAREEVYICNVVKCRPPENRTPQDDEMRMCGQFLTRQLEVLKPQFIVALGATAARYLIGTNQSMGRLRGRFFDHSSGARILPTYHPAYLLRNPSAKKMVWDDVKKVMAEVAQKEQE